ncbi:hypothetical protein L7F22_037201 [Adiantum nelumboides]|nr:hypothetical protein [Adiantum nelumboides]
MPDAQMTVADSVPAPNGASEAKKVQEPPAPKDIFLTLLRHNLLLIVRSVAHLEPRFAARALRSLASSRKLCSLHPDVLARAIEEGTAKDSEVRSQLLAVLPQAFVPSGNGSTTRPTTGDAMDVDSAEGAEGAAKKSIKDAAALADTSFKHAPEASAELNAYNKADQFLDSQAAIFSRRSLQQIQAANKRTLDQVCARTIFYLARCVELLKGQGKSGGLAEERDFLLSLHRTAALRHDNETNATVQNILLRSYIVESNLYDQADKLVARAPFPRAQAGNGQIARYEYYVGRIRAVQLNYTEAHTHLQQAIRRAPQPSSKAKREEEEKRARKEEGKDDTKDSDEKPVADAYTVLKAELAKVKPTSPGAGFLQTAYKFLVVVELLMGDIPERSVFRMDVLKKALAPYMEIVQAVRIGDLSLFAKTLSTHNALFLADKTHSLILRLRHNVIKTGIRTISLAYSRISLSDITRKLHLESEEDAEYIVAKAIRDGVIEAQVDHERGEMRSRETGEVYSTNEPQAQLRQRINFCLQLHNESVKAMRYPLDNHKAELDSASAARERERELAKEIADGDISDEDEDWV